MISFSGIDCAGKSTQINNVSEALIKQGRKCKIIWNRGGYTPLLEGIKTLIRSDKNGSREEHAAYRDRIHSSSKKRKLLLWLSILDMIGYYGIYFRIVEMREMIIADRYIWDSYIDFKLKYEEFDFENWLVWKILLKVYLKPKISIIYTIPAEESMRRSELKFEPFPEEIEMRRIRIERYMEEIKKSRWQYRIDATKTIDEVFKKTMCIIEGQG